MRPNMRVLLKLATFAVLTMSCQAIRCWVCENAISNTECLARGKVQQCMDNQEACETVVRKIDRGFIFTKKCKQSHACHNNNIQNSRPAWFPTQCNGDSTASHCTCCCRFDECNTFSNCQSASPKCSIPQIPDNGSRRCSGKDVTLRGTTCQFSCNEGFELIGSATVSCIASKPFGSAWSHSFPECQAIRCPLVSAPQNGFQSCSGAIFRRRNSNCIYECEPGYVLNGASSIICGANGQWSNSVPRCEQVTCSPRHVSPSNGEVICDNNNLVGSVCRFSCDSGHGLVGSATSVCSQSGNIALWNNAPPACQPIKCGAQPALGNGSVSCTIGDNVQSVCNFVCDEGYALRGASNTTCIDNNDGDAIGSWSNDAPACDFVPIPPNNPEGCPPHTRMDACIVLDSSSSVRSANWPKMINFAKFIVSSFEMSHDDTRFSVFSYDTKVNRDSQILLNSYIADSAGLLEDLDGMGYNRGLTMTGKALHHVDDVIFQPENGQRAGVKKVLIVVTDGDSDATSPVKEIAQKLRDQGTLIYAIGIGFDVNPDELVDISGKEGHVFYQEDGFDTLNQNLADVIGRAICDNDVKCQSPTVPQNGQMKCSADNNLGSDCEFFCDDGFVLEGQSASTCTKKDSLTVWTSDSPLCIEVQKCDDVVAPPNGNMLCSAENDLDSICTFFCDDGYVLEGEFVTTCTKQATDLTWTSATPTCTKVLKCEDLTAPLNGEISCSASNGLNSICIFSCHEGYSLEGEKRLTCLKTNNDAAWTSTSPKCVKDRTLACPPHTLMDACIILDSSSSVRQANWPKMINFAKYIISSFEMSDDDSRFSVFSYDTRVHRDSQILLNSYIQDKAGLLAELDTMRYHAGLTMTGKAMQHARDVIFQPENGQRAGVRKVLIVVTDGDTDATSPVQNVARQLRDEGTLIYAVGIGFDVDPDKLAEISGNQERTFYQEEGFQTLNIGLAGAIGKAICKDERCDAQRAPQNGQMICSAGRALNSVCTFSCDAGFTLEGRSASSCVKQHTGMGWTTNTPTCVEVQKCDVRIVPQNGEVVCTSGNNLDSTCTFSCDEGFTLQGESSSTCQKQNSILQWSSVTPECLKDENKKCPPHARMDACIVLDSSSSVRRANWPKMISFAKYIISSFEMADDDTRFSIFSYDTRVNRGSQILLNSYIQDKESLLADLDTMRYHAGLTMTGRAMQHARDVIFQSENGKRDGVQKVLIVVTDGDTDATSPVEEISNQLKEEGTLIYAVGIGFDVDPDKLLEISGSQERTFYQEEGFDTLTQALAEQIGGAICEKGAAHQK